VFRPTRTCRLRGRRLCLPTLDFLPIPCAQRYIFPFRLTKGAGPPCEEMKKMALIADLCPHCRRGTRCNVVERGASAGGIFLGVPLVLPLSSVSCTCGECGFEFRSEFWDQGRSVSPAEAALLDIEALLGRTNPALKEKLALSQLQENPRLSGAFALLG